VPGSAYCNNCGRSLDGPGPRCPSCGAALDPALADGPPTQAVRPAGSAREAILSVPAHSGADFAVLVVERGPNVGSRFAVEKASTTVGRDPDSDIFLDDVTVSRHHAVVLQPEPTVHLVRDAGSLNGTYVNGERVEEAVLEHGDLVQVGLFKLVFLASGP
jgi:pSer/pThr/pTyr-binding forkhead associated (FHA) protein